MGATIANEPGALLIWSPREADRLTEQAVGWRVTAIDNAAGTDRLTTPTEARMVVIDARAEWAEALRVALLLGAMPATEGGAMLALVSPENAETLDQFLDAGATHFLVAPWTAVEFSAALRFAAASGGRRSPEIVEPLVVDLRRGIARGEIDVLFQPQVALKSGTIVGVEALARWEHPRLGAIGAEPLFAAAERAGLGPALSAHVQALALSRAAAWPGSLSALRLSVNVTAQDLGRADFAGVFLGRVQASGFPVARVTAEITETGLIAELEQAAARLETLRAAGCRVAIDDFGTGYSSLAYLKALPLDYLKIDRALSQDIAGSARDRAVVRGVIGIARALGLAVIAEGVETAEQRDLLAAEGCDLYQGFLCAEAVDVDALARLVEE